MSSEIVPFADGNDAPSAEKGEHLEPLRRQIIRVKRTKPSDTGKGKATVRRPLGTIEEDVRPFDLVGLRNSVECPATQRRFWVEADLIGGNHDMRHSLSSKKGPKCVTKLNPNPEFVKPLLEKIKEPSVLQLRGCDQLFSSHRSPFSFEKFKTLTCLEICGVSNLTTFPENTISEMAQLQFLNLSHLPIPQLSSDFFSKLVHLRSLTLKDCPNIHSLPQLPQMNVLEYLELSHLPIQQIPTDLFSKLVHLRSLTLKDCPNIHSLPKLPKMAALEYLELSHLLIATFPDGFFSRSSCLDRLILRGCSKLTSLPSFQPLEKLGELDLSHCTALQEIELKQFSFHVRKVDLSYTGLHKLRITSTLIGATSITRLFLRDAKVIDFLEFPECLFSRLEVLDVSGAQYLKHPALLTQSRALEALDLSRTRIEFESIDFISFIENLRCLILRDCTWLQKLPAMEKLTRLEVLDISGCENLCDLPEDFNSLKKLKKINLFGCIGLKESSPALFDKMTFVENFPSLTNLQTLNISDPPKTGKVTILDVAGAPESRIENIHPRLSKPNELYIVSTFFTNSGFDRFKQHFDLIVHLISRFQENFKPVSSLDAIPIHTLGNRADGDIYNADKRAKTDVESCPISGQTVKMQCRRMVADLEYIRDNIGLLESCPSCTIAENLLDQLTDATSQFQPSLFEEDVSHFYFQLNSTNFYEVLRRVAKLKQLVPPRQVDALVEKEKFKERLGDGDEQEDVIQFGIHTDMTQMQNFSSSYESLTKTQKNCLLLFTVFFPRADIKERMLIELWYGEGLIDPQHGENLNLDPTTAYSDPNQETTSASIEAGTTSTTNNATRVSLQVSTAHTIEEVGQNILTVLEEEQFIFQCFSKGPMGARTWGVPLDVQPFLRARAMEEGLFNVDHETRMLIPHLSSGSERACLLISQNNLPSSSKLWADYTNSSEKMEFFKTIRTLLNVNARIVDIRAEWFSKMTNLAVFHLGRCPKDDEAKHESIEVMDLKFLEELKNMKELRLLNLEGFLAIKKLPDSVCKLTNLRILNLRECGYLEELPAGIGSLKNLTHLDLIDCPVLCMLPKGIRLLSKLEVLKGFVIYYQIGGRQHRNACTLGDLLKLDKLRILKLVVHTEGFPFPNSSDLHILNRMKNLCSLRIVWQQNYNALDEQHRDIVGQKASSSSRWNLHQLKCWEQRTSQNETDELLLRSNIKKLELRCFPFETSPNWLQPSGLQKLERLSVRGGRLKTLATNNNQDTWSVKILSLRYLPNMDMEVKEIRCNFPHMTDFETHECEHLRYEQIELVRK